jgi:hypothetical protein
MQCSIRERMCSLVEHVRSLSKYSLIDHYHFAVMEVACGSLCQLTSQVLKI